ncbi:hypothetical protein ACFV4P_09010 [Kitasatospora sp. NPDC059795]|uniref:hypothetical protein n=1 Tax=Kitasatospora sp. NPDC059795 TaxID=3346949 RepID=UPI00365EF760
MPMSRGGLHDVPLSTLFPALPAADVDALRHAAGAIDTSGPEAAAAKWEWCLEHSVFTGPECATHVILLFDVVHESEGYDWFEFLLDVGWTADGRHLVTAVVNVGCWCETDHGTHNVDVLQLAVGDGLSLPQAFAACAGHLSERLTDPRDADHWRAFEGLPARSA